MKIEKSELRDYLSVEGDHNRIEIRKELQSQKSVFDFITDLPEAAGSDREMVRNFRDEARPHVDALRNEHFVLLSCGDPEIGQSAVYALIEALGVPKAQQKLLNAERIYADVIFDIYQLTMRRVDGEAETVMLLDATSRGQRIIDSLYSIRGSLSKDDIINSFRRQKLRVICLVSPQKLASRSGEIPFHRWDLPHLTYLLRPHFPDNHEILQSKITQQRQKGCWATDDVEFGRQIRSLIDQKTLEEVVEQGGPSPASVENDTPRDDDSPLRLMVLYVATFYPRLAPSEFEAVLTTIAGDQRIPGTATEKTKEDRPLVDVWKERSHVVLGECQLMTDRTSRRVIEFRETGRRDRLRAHFEENYGVYVQRLFLDAWQKGLLFDPSEQIAEDLTLLILDLMRTDTEQFGCDWLFEIFERLPENAADRRRALRRLAQLLGRMLGEESSEPIVPRLLNRLLHATRHDDALEMVKRLRLVPRFDELYWLKQIIDRSDASTRDNAVRYIEIEFYRRPDLYPLLEGLSTWLRDQPANSLSTQAALHIAFRYLLDTTNALDKILYGMWPSRLPLLNVNAVSANASFSCLFRFLFHPAMPDVIAGEIPDEDASSILFALLAEWIFVLLAPSKNGESPAEAAGFTAGDALSAFVERLVRAISVEPRPGLSSMALAYWERMRITFLYGPKLPAGVQRRHEFAWKRVAVTRLITEFRRVQRELRPVLKEQRSFSELTGV